MTLLRDAREAVHGADLVVTDVWTSMGQEEQKAQRHAALAAYQVNGALMQRARPKALFMHCLPAHRGEEVTAEVLDGPQSVVWREAENRLHAQKALLEFLLKPAARGASAGGFKSFSMTPAAAPSASAGGNRSFSRTPAADSPKVRKRTK